MTDVTTTLYTNTIFRIAQCRAEVIDGLDPKLHHPTNVEHDAYALGAVDYFDSLPKDIQQLIYDRHVV